MAGDSAVYCATRASHLFTTQSRELERHAGHVAVFGAELCERLTAAGIYHDDPDPARLRAWNVGGLAAGRISIETRRGQFGKTRRVVLADGAA